MSSLQDPPTRVLQLDCTKIPEHIQLKAKQELGETDTEKSQCLEKLRQLIQGEYNLKCNTSDNFLLQFLRVRKYKIHEAFNLIKKYYQHKKTYGSFYRNYTPKSFPKIMEKNFMNYLPIRSPEGSAVWAVQFGKWDPAESCFEDFLSFGHLCIEQGLKNPVTQICGIVALVDFKDMSWSHLFHISPTSMKCYVNAQQDSFPLRLKAVHVINNPGIFGFLFAMIKPLLKTKLKNRIHLHGSNLDNLHHFLPVDMLPEEFGGSQGTFQNENFYSSLLASEEEFKECNKYGYG